MVTSRFPGAGTAVRFRPPQPGHVGYKGERKACHGLRALGVPILPGAFIDDGERERELDVLAFPGGRILVVEVKSTPGHPPRWSADGVRLVGPATLAKAERQIGLQVAALARVLPGAEVAGIVLFSERVRIEPPRDWAVTLDRLPDIVAAHREGEASPETLAAWDWLCALRER